MQILSSGMPGVPQAARQAGPRALLFLPPRTLPPRAAGVPQGAAAAGHASAPRDVRVQEEVIVWLPCARLQHLETVLKVSGLRFSSTCGIILSSTSKPHDPHLWDRKNVIFPYLHVARSGGRVSWCPITGPSLFVARTVIFIVVAVMYDSFIVTHH